MKTMTITIDEYPVDFSFRIRRKLPKFKWGCSTRTKIIREKFKGFYFDNHVPNDFIVEKIIKTPRGEIWFLGS